MMHGMVSSPSGPSLFDGRKEMMARLVDRFFCDPVITSDRKFHGDNLNAIPTVEVNIRKMPWVTKLVSMSQKIWKAEVLTISSCKLHSVSLGT
jgi:hypothetical protein